MCSCIWSSIQNYVVHTRWCIWHHFSPAQNTAGILKRSIEFNFVSSKIIRCAHLFCRSVSSIVVIMSYVTGVCLCLSHVACHLLLIDVWTYRPVSCLALIAPVPLVYHNVNILNICMKSQSQYNSNTNIIIECRNDCHMSVLDMENVEIIMDKPNFY